MKALLFLTTLLLPLATLAQSTDDIYYSPNQKETSFNQKKSVFSVNDTTQIQRVITCLDNFQQERQNATWTGLAGTGCVVGASFMNDENTRNIVYGIGGFALIASGVMYISADRWLKRSRLTISPTGVKLTF